MSTKDCPAAGSAAFRRNVIYCGSHMIRVFVVANQLPITRPADVDKAVCFMYALLDVRV